MPHPLEHDEQRTVVAWLRARGYTPAWVRNEERRTPQKAAWLKARGMQRGWPDLIVLETMRGRPVAIEMKTATGIVSPPQARIHDSMRAAGWVVLVGTADNVIPELEELGYGAHKSTRTA